MDSYSKQEFQTMQQEAIRRVKEMHKRSQQYVSNMPPSDDIQTNSIPVHNNSRQSSQNNNTVNQSSQNIHQNNNLSNQAGNTTYINRNNINSPRSNPSGNNNNKQQENSQNHQKQSQQQNSNGNQQPINNQVHRNNQQYNMGNPFSQLFGSNLGGFNKFKQMFSPLAPKKHPENSPDTDKEKKPLDGLLDGILKDFEIDNEKIMLGILIYLLYKNGSDVKLLLALGYLLL